MTAGTSRTFLLEVGCEEIPAAMVQPAVEDLTRRLCAALESLRAGAVPGEAGHPPAPFGGPRRLVAWIEGLRDREEDRVVQVSGPPVTAAYDREGRPTKAASGFAKAQGVSVEQLERVRGEKGEVVAARRKEIGRRATDVLAEACPRILSGLRFPKMMKWGDQGYWFVRPVHWIVALLDGEVVDFEFMGARAGRLSQGHRFLAPGPHVIPRAVDYEQVLAEQGRVIVRTSRRRTRIIEARERAAGSMGWVVTEDEPLLDELVFLNEYPGVIAGTYPKDLLDLPAAVLITAMKHHQKYFPAYEKTGALAPGFLAVTNLDGDPDGDIRRGNEWVLKARLADARFFWGEDRKRRLEDRIADLARVTFQEKLGSNLARVERLERLTERIAGRCGIDAGGGSALRQAARLCKTDLTTGMVGEFPELQGVMGGIYARAEGLPAEVAVAIEEHYRPVSPTGPCPTTEAGCLLSVADKLDLLAGCFTVGLIPKGSADPYGLRRAAHGICRVLMAEPMGRLRGPLRLDEAVLDALEQFAVQGIAFDRRVAETIVDFLAQRLRFLMEESGIRLDTARAVLGSGAADVRDAWLRARALTSLRGPEHEADFVSIATSAKRMRNILQQAQERQLPVDGAVEPGRLVEVEEKDLHAEVVRARAAIEEAIAARNYEMALRRIAALRAPIDRFFDKVLVMSPDESLRRNRLAVISGLSALLRRVADFSEIVVEGESPVGDA